MTERKTVLKPVKRAGKNLKDFARRAKALHEAFAAQGRQFSDSAELVRRDRE